MTEFVRMRLLDGSDRPTPAGCEGEAVRYLRAAKWIAAALLLAGCQSTPKPPPGLGTDGPANRPFMGAEAAGEPRSGALTGGRIDLGRESEISGVLAGSLIDGNNRRPANAFIRVSLAEEIGTGKAISPIEVEANPQGHFLIQGLKPGQTYILSARARDGATILSGEAQVRPPNTRILIPLSADRSSTVPPLPTQSNPWAAPSVAPGAAPSGPSNIRPVDLGTPASDPSRITEAPSNRPPVANVPAPPPPPTESRSDSPGQTSCTIEGRYVQNFVLPDTDGRPWDFRRDHRGKLVLLDFWGTWCTPCLRLAPTLKGFQKAYGGYGLEIVGIACERAAPADRARLVKDTHAKLGLNYLTLVADDHDTCPVQTKFQIQAWPTLILLDASGNILWRGDNRHLRELETLIRQRLGAP